MKLIDLRSVIPNIIVDLRYATANNITGQILYDQKIVPGLIEPAAFDLIAGAKTLWKQGLRVVVWDAARPIDAQKRLLEVINDSNYVLEESNHCKGLAVDITLADEAGNYLDMGTGHDLFSDKAHANASDLTETQTDNRRLLVEVMNKCGFEQWPYEWWHFDYIRQLET